MSPTQPLHRLEHTPAVVPQNRISSVYDRIAPIYDGWGWLTERRARRRALDLAAVRDGENVLEVAVGTGLAFRHLVSANPNGRTEGIDLSAGMLSRARRKVKSLPGRWILRQASALELPFAGAEFDLLLNNYMFDLLTVAEMEAALAEFHRVLRPRGRLVLANMTHGETAPARFFEAVYRLSPQLMGGCRGVQLSELVARAGFRITRPREYIVQALFPSEIIHAIRE